LTVTTTQRFQALWDEFTQKEYEMAFGTKERDYGGEEDKLRVNRLISIAKPEPLPQTFLTLWLKHVFAITVAVMRMSWNWCWTRKDGHEGFKQRIADARVYLLLLAASIQEIEDEKTSLLGFGVDGSKNPFDAQYQQDIQAQITDVKASMWAAFQGYNLDEEPPGSCTDAATRELRDMRQRPSHTLHIA